MFRRTAIIFSQHVKLTTVAPVAGSSKPDIKPSPGFHPSQLLRFVYEANPGLINCTTLFPTREFAEDISHPFHIKTIRKLEAFDKEKFHWRVQCPVDVSKRAFVRSWAAKRVSQVLMGRVGEITDGKEAKTEDGGAQAIGKDGLRGALLVILNKDKISLTASDEEVKQSIDWLLERVREKQVQKQRPEQAAHAPSRDKAISKPRSVKLPPIPRVVMPKASEEGGPAPLDSETCRKQIEFYFSDTNVLNDRHMLHLTGGEENKAVTLEKLLKFKRMKGYRKDVGFVIKALTGSEEVEVIRIRGGKDDGGAEGEDVEMRAKDWGVRRKVPVVLPSTPTGIENESSTG